MVSIKRHRKNEGLGKEKEWGQRMTKAGRGQNVLLEKYEGKETEGRHHEPRVLTLSCGG